MNKPAKIILTLTILIGSVLGLSAQNSTITPYSRFGYGILSDNATASQRNMGGVGYAMNSGRQINVMNPASYAAIDSLTFLFDMGVDFTTLWSKENGTSNKAYGGGLDYVTMQVPITKWLGASAGILPYGSTGYAFGNDIKNGSVERNGTGSLNQLYLGAGVNPVKGLYVGFNVAYLFGTITNSDYVTTSGGLSSLFERQMEVRDWRADIGVQYVLPISRKNTLTFGLTYSPKKNLHGNVYGIYYDASASGVVPDTVNAGDTRMNGRYSTPESWGAGINWQWNNKLMVEADFTYQPWSKAKFATIEHFESNRFANRYRVGLGLQYQPEQRASYFKCIRYRAGVFYDRDYIMVRDNHVKEYGASIGFGLPVPGFKTLVNIGLEYRHRQASPQALVKEDYLNLTVGINFNEMWFRKSKIY